MEDVRLGPKLNVVMRERKPRYVVIKDFVCQYGLEIPLLLYLALMPLNIRIIVEYVNTTQEEIYTTKLNANLDAPRNIWEVSNLRSKKGHQRLYMISFSPLN